MKKAVLKIRVWTDGDKELPDELGERLVPHLEHIAGLCEQGYTSGQVFDEEHFNGWWSIEDDDSAE